MNYTDLLGVKFKVHGRNKDEGFDCYGLAIEVLKRNSIYLKDVFYDNLKQRKEVHDNLHSIISSVRIENPKINCIIEIAVHGEPLHIGIYIGNGLMIHTTSKTNVVIEPIKRYKHLILGYYDVSNN